MQFSRTVKTDAFTLIIFFHRDPSSVIGKVVQYAVNNEALLVTNDNYKNLTFENGAFKEQIDKRLVGYKWEGEDFTMSYERKTEAWFPNINSINWKPQKKPSVSERQREITGASSKR